MADRKLILRGFTREALLGIARQSDIGGLSLARRCQTIHRRAVATQTEKKTSPELLTRDGLELASRLRAVGWLRHKQQTAWPVTGIARRA